MTGFVASPVIFPGFSRNSRALLRRARCHQTKSRRCQRLTTANSAATPSASPEPSKETKSPVRYEDVGARVVPVSLFLRGTAGETVAGVYGVLGENRDLLFVGMSRDVATSLRTHLANNGEGAVQFVRVMTFAMPKAREMKMVLDTWIQDNGSVPKGNEEKWVESDVELAQQASLIDITLQNDSEPIISPFEDAEIETQELPEAMKLTAENVDEVLNEVRPYLISDGGNVSVVSVNTDSGKVELQLEGACGSCSSASVTMQAGIEKALRAKFRGNLGVVEAVSKPPEPSGVTTEKCEKVLDEVRAALHGLGATVKVLDVDEDEVIVSFSGPNNLKYGVESMLVEKVPGVAAVTFE